MENLTKVIIENSNKSLNKKQKTIIAFIASVFSVLFALSIVFELTEIVSGYVLAFLIIFVIIFLVLNEKFKIESVRSIYKGNKRSIIPFAITFLISVSLSSIGVYLWTNDSFNQKLANSNNKASQELLIKNKYQDRIKQIKSKSFANTEEYSELKESIAYWKSRRAANVEERSYIREQIEKAENNLITARDEFNNDIEGNIVQVNQLMEAELSQLETVSSNQIKTIDFKDKISYIFFIMIFITELGIIVLNKEMAEIEIKIEEFANSDMARKYMLARKVLISLYLTKDKENKTSITHALYSSPVQKMAGTDEKKWNAVKNLYNHFINLGILSDGEVKKSKTKKKILVNEIVMDEVQALATFDNYYNKLLTL